MYPIILSVVFIPLTFNGIIDRYLLLFYCFFLFLSLSLFFYFWVPLCSFYLFYSFLDFPGGSDGKTSAYNAGDPGSFPGWGRSSGEGNGNTLQYSCLENPGDGGAWRAAGSGSHRVGHNWSKLAAAAASILTGKSHGRRSLVSYSPCGCKEPDTIERLHFLFHSFLSCSLMVHLILCLYNLVFVHLL